MGNSQGSAKPIANDIKLEWTRDKTDCPYESREGQVAAVVGNKVYLFGGVCFRENSDQESNTLYVYDVSRHEWSRIDPSKDNAVWPPARSGAAMAAVGEKLYVYGGLSQATGWLDDFYVFDTVSNKWNELDGDRRPSPRDKAAMVTVQDEVFLFGGFCPNIQASGPPETADIVQEDDGDEDCEDVVEEDVRQGQVAMTMGWSDELWRYCLNKSAWELVTNKGEATPSARAAHAMSATTEYLYVMGGRDFEGRQNDLWRFDLSKSAWEIVYCSGLHPDQLSFHQMVAISDKRLAVYGGRNAKDEHSDRLHVLDIPTCQWLQPMNTAPVYPPPMGMHCMCIANSVVLVLGGSAGLERSTGTCSKHYNAVHCFQLSMLNKGGAIKAKEENEKDNDIEEAEK